MSPEIRKHEIGRNLYLMQRNLDAALTVIVAAEEKDLEEDQGTLLNRLILQCDALKVRAVKAKEDNPRITTKTTA